MNKPKIAAKHLDPCDETNCRFNHDKVINDDMDTKFCCFGLRHGDALITIPLWSDVSVYMPPLRWH